MSNVKSILTGAALLCACAGVATSASGVVLDTSLFNRVAEMRTSYSSAAALTNFPLLVRVSSSRLPGFVPSASGANGGNLRFTDAAGNLLVHEVDEWHPDGDSILWVSVPEFKAGMVFNVHYDPKPDAELPAMSPKSVWDGADYKAVWHFADTNLTNSSSGTIPIRYNTGITVSNVTAFAGRGIRRNKGMVVTDYLKHGIGSTHCTWSIYVRWANLGWNQHVNYILKGGWASSNGGWYTEFKNNPQSLRLIVGTTVLDFGTANGYDWNHLAMSYNGSKIRTYVNGSLVNTHAVTIQDGNHDFTWGTSGDDWQDEFRIRDAVSPDAWIRAERDMMANGQYVTFTAAPPPVPAVKLDTTLFRHSAGLRATGYSGSATLTNFPLLVRLSSARCAGFDYSAAGEKGANLRFADLSGNLLPHEIDEWNTNGESLVWVLMTELRPGSALAAYWDPKPDAVLPDVMPTDVWDCAGYLGVWHFGETNLTDASSAAIPARYAAGTVVSNVAAFAGRGIVRNNTLTIPDYLRRGVGGSHWSWSGWLRCLKHTSTANTFQPIRKGSYVSSSGGWFIEYKNSLSTLRLIMGTDEQTFGAATGTDWNHLSMTYDGTTVRTYVNGKPANSYARTLQHGTYDFVFYSEGCEAQDEFRVRNIVSSDAWIYAEKEMMCDTDFVTFLAEVPSVPVASLGPKFASRFDFKVRVTTPGYAGESAQANFPLLLRLAAGSPKNFRPSDCGANGAGLRAFAVDGSLLPLEVDEWHPDGESLVWVLVPALSADAAQSAVTLCWGPRAGGAVPAPDPALLWSRAGYKAVWHFASAGAKMPSSAYGTLPMTPSSADGVTTVAGKVGQGLSAQTTVTAPDYYVHNVPASGYSVSFWAKFPDQANSDFYQPIGKGWWENGWRLECRQNVLRPRIIYNDTFTPVAQDVDVRGWHYYTFSYSSWSPKFFHDITELALSSKTVTANPTPFALNHQSSRTEQYDEIRVRAATSSLARQTAEYRNMTNATFVRYEVLHDPGTILVIR